MVFILPELAINSLPNGWANRWALEKCPTLNTENSKKLLAGDQNEGRVISFYRWRAVNGEYYLWPQKRAVWRHCLSPGA